MNSSGSRFNTVRKKEDFMTLNWWKLKRWKSKGRTVCATALLSFAAGSLFTARLAHINQVRADSNRVFEMHIYHTLRGKAPALESQFRDTTSKLLAKHDLKIVGYWVPEGTPAWDNTFIFIVAHSSREEAKKNWDAICSCLGRRRPLTYSEKIFLTIGLPRTELQARNNLGQSVMQA